MKKIKNKKNFLREKSSERENIACLLLFHDFFVCFVFNMETA